MSQTHSTDIAIIGAGPVGLFAAFQAGMLGLSSHVVDALDFIGGQCTALYPEKPIYDIPGFPSVLAEDLITSLEKQAAPFSPHYHLGQQVTALRKEGDSWLLETSKGHHINCKAVIIAAGCGAFGPNRPPLENLESFEGKSVFYMVGKREEMRGKRVVIAGGGDSAVDWVLALQGIAQSIAIIHRRPKFRCAPDSYHKLKALSDAGKVELVIPYQLDSLEGDNGVLRTVNVKTLDGDIRKIEADILLPFYGLAMDLGPIANWGLQVDKTHISVTQNTMQTSEKGIFAIGDIAHYLGKLKLILSGFAEAAQACHEARAVIYPDKEFHFEYSTTQGVPA